MFPSGYRRTGDGWKFTERRYEVRYHDQSPLASSGSGPSLTSGHFSFRFVICALAAREMPETAEWAAVPAVTFGPETTPERCYRPKR